MTLGTCLLVLSSPMKEMLGRFKVILPHLGPKVQNVLYVQLMPTNGLGKEGLLLSQPAGVAQASHLLTQMYRYSVQSQPLLDTRVLLTGLKSQQVATFRTSRPIDAVVFDSAVQNREQLLEQWFPDAPRPHVVELKEAEEMVLNDVDEHSLEVGETDSVYGHVVLGGTFDRLHSGHKILLSQALLRSRNTVTVGVATGMDLLKSKVLPELMLPVEDRVADVEEFLRDCFPHLEEYNVVPITDPFGPSVEDPRLDLIVGSEETHKGCLKVNQVRLAKSMSRLDVHLIRMVEEETKEGEINSPAIAQLSSTNQRIRLLGSQLKPPLIPWVSSGPYVIGLTGGSASGKTNISNYLASLGAGVVNCDLLGHKAYAPGTKGFENVVQAFGPDVVKEGVIDRAKLGSLVFGPNNAGNLAKLNGIVWPEILKLAEHDMQKLFQEENKKVVVLDASVLLAAGWQTKVHQVWVSIVDRREAVKRIMERDGKNEEEATKRLQSQISNQEFVSAANVVFCSKWSKEFTQSQVKKAWDRLETEYLLPS